MVCLLHLRILFYFCKSLLARYLPVTSLVLSVTRVAFYNLASVWKNEEENSYSGLRDLDSLRWQQGHTRSLYWRTLRFQRCKSETVEVALRHKGEYTRHQKQWRCLEGGCIFYPTHFSTILNGILNKEVTFNTAFKNNFGQYLIWKIKLMSLVCCGVFGCDNMWSQYL